MRGSLRWWLMGLLAVWLPGIGSALAGMLWGWAGIRQMPLALAEGAFAALGMDWDAQRKAMETERGFFLGLALASAAVSAVPVVNALVPAAAAAGIAAHWAQRRE
ncbi:MAG: hypothetical protein D6771_00790 [Zetaproteobacteria bacterium]|nr:MAG: hypothetical protein D6771_00790 [Zetaproteobacteria bacterium]